ncbi:MAG: hypothetical protein J5679_03180 [Alphaproteobacteria bacterium]|nr:hypothetical protein [Alphaproteobacteria bacterium]
MSTGSTYGALNIETTYHNSWGIGKLTVSGRAQKVLDLMDQIMMLKDRKKKNTQASEKWLSNCDSAIESDYRGMRMHLVGMLGKHADEEADTINNIIQYAKQEDVNNLRYNVLKLLEKHCNPEGYRRLREQYEVIVSKQRG